MEKETKMQQELEELKSKPEKVRAMIALLESLLEEDERKKSENKYSVSLKECIQKHLLELGIPQQISGARYLVECIEIVVENPLLAMGRKGKSYSVFAERLNTTPSKIDRTIRYAIELCWERADRQTLQKYFGGIIAKRLKPPVNLEFIAVLANRVRMEMQ